MKKKLARTGILILVCTVGGCGSSPDRAAKDLARDLDALSDLLEKGPEELKQSQAKIEELKTRVEEDSEKLKKFSEHDLKKMGPQAREALTQASIRLDQVRMKLTKQAFQLPWLNKLPGVDGGTLPGNDPVLPGLPGPEGSPKKSPIK